MPNIRHHLIINAGPQDIYNACTLQEGLSKWWTTDTLAKHELGFINEFRFGGDYLKRMKITKLDSPSLIEWQCIEFDEQWHNTLLRFEIIEKDDNTLLKFSHLDWKEETDFFGFCNYQWGRYLNSLKSLCETGIGHPWKA